MLKNYFKIAFRRLVKEKQYVITNMVGFTIGIVSCMLIGLYVYNELSHDTYHKGHDRIYRVLEDRPVNDAIKRYEWSMNQAFSEKIPQVIPEVESAVSVTLTQPFSYLKRDEDQYRELDLIAASGSFFDLFTHPLVHGSKEGILDRPNTIAISESTARQIFGNTNVVGKTLTAIRDHFGKIDELTMEITGVFRDVPGNSHFLFDAVSSLRSDPGVSYMFSQYIKLTPGASPKQVVSKIDQASTATHGEAEILYEIQPLTDIYLGEYSAQRKGDAMYVYLFLDIAS
ncbi:MAG: ABC transporter permease [Balneolaceae bacterium]|nr:ABC transporter permease [Balneolaceae bacterium]